MSIDGANAEFDHVGLGPAVRFREEQIAAARLRRAECAEPDVVFGIGEFETGLAAGQRLQLIEGREIRRHDQDDLEE
ncbi:hypothetical protein ACVWWG_002604 [Bradyrhizobium sp. LB7.2]